MQYITYMCHMSHFHFSHLTVGSQHIRDVSAHHAADGSAPDLSGPLSYTGMCEWVGGLRERESVCVCSVKGKDN